MGGQPVARWLITGDEKSEASTLIDQERQILSHAAFISVDSVSLFSCYHAPRRSTPRGGVVVCPPVLAEAPRNYRREVLLAEALAEIGIASLRFHYRDSGNSDTVSDVTMTGLVDDAVAAAEHLRAVAQVDRMAFVGTRLGAIVAASARRAYGGPLILWEPAVDSQKYFDELFRARLIAEMKTGSTSGGMAGLRAELKDSGMIEISGYRLARKLHDSAVGARLLDPLGDPDGPMLVLEMNRRQRIRPEILALVEQWRRAGHPAESGVIALDEPWWFGASSRADTYEARTTGLEMIPLSVEFLDRVWSERP